MNGVFRLRARVCVAAVLTSAAAAFPATAGATTRDVSLPGRAAVPPHVTSDKPATHPLTLPAPEEELYNPLQGIAVVEVL